MGDARQQQLVGASHPLEGLELRDDLLRRSDESRVEAVDDGAQLLVAERRDLARVLGGRIRDGATPLADREHPLGVAAGESTRFLLRLRDKHVGGHRHVGLGQFGTRVEVRPVLGDRVEHRVRGDMVVRAEPQTACPRQACARARRRTVHPHLDGRTRRRLHVHGSHRIHRLVVVGEEGEQVGDIVGERVLDIGRTAKEPRLDKEALRTEEEAATRRDDKPVDNTVLDGCLLGSGLRGGPRVGAGLSSDGRSDQVLERRAAQPQVEARAEELRDRPERLRHLDRVVVAEQRRGRADADALRRPGQHAKQRERRGSSHARVQMMLGEPEARIAGPLGRSRELERIRKRLSGGTALDDRHEIEHGQGHTARSRGMRHAPHSRRETPLDSNG